MPKSFQDQLDDLRAEVCVVAMLAGGLAGVCGWLLGQVQKSRRVADQAAVVALRAASVATCAHRRADEIGGAVRDTALETRRSAGDLAKRLEDVACDAGDEAGRGG